MVDVEREWKKGSSPSPPLTRRRDTRPVLYPPRPQASRSPPSPTFDRLQAPEPTALVLFGQGGVSRVRTTAPFGDRVCLAPRGFRKGADSPPARLHILYTLNIENGWASGEAALFLLGGYFCVSIVRPTTLLMFLVVVIN